MTTETASRARIHPDLPAAARLENQVMFRISGPGTDDFLQGQLSQNLADVTASHSPRGAASTPKGRAYLLTRLVRDGDDILLTIPATMADDVATQLNKYLMLFRGTTMERLNQAQVIGLLGEQAAATVTGDSAQVPTATNATLAVDGSYLVRTNSTADGLARFELWLPTSPTTELQNRITTLPEATQADWAATEIAAGIAELAPDTREAWVPQMLNWQHLEGIHFRKGCYTGQEVIARMHFLGQLKKSLYRLGTPQGDAPEPGTAIMAGDKPVGEVVRAVAMDDDSLQLLAVLKHAAAGADLTLEGSEHKLTVLALPYPVPEREADAGENSDT